MKPVATSSGYRYPGFHKTEWHQSSVAQQLERSPKNVVAIELTAYVRRAMGNALDQGDYLYDDEITIKARSGIIQACLTAPVSS